MNVPNRAIRHRRLREPLYPLVPDMPHPARQHISQADPRRQRSGSRKVIKRCIANANEPRGFLYIPQALAPQKSPAFRLASSWAGGNNGARLLRSVIERRHGVEDHVHDRHAAEMIPARGGNDFPLSVPETC
jgi:hypothetical protein